MGEILRALEPLEQRFGAGRKISQRIGAALSKLPVQQMPQTQTELSVDEICRLTSWPKSKPIAEIVFPHPLQTSHRPIPTLWVMLPKEDIQSRLTCTRYNQFLFTQAPHPMLLWITVLHRQDAGPRWLPCYLDLKTAVGQEMTRLLGQAGQYRILFFPLEEPHRCIDVKTANVASLQCTLLQQWANDARSQMGINQPNLSKQLLRQELEKLKPKILRKLEAIHEDATDISG